MISDRQQGYQGLVMKLIGINIVIYILQIFGGIGAQNIIIEYFALKPYSIINKLYLWQFVSYMFFHGNPAHILFNMYAVLIFGIPIEQEWGSRRFLFYYLFTGIGAGITIFVINLIFPGPGYYIPTIGASGAVFGLLLAFGIMYPDVELLLFFFIPIKAKYLVVLYGLLELFLELQGSVGNISHLGHLGGLFFGLVYFMIFRKHAISFKAKIMQNRLMKNLEEHKKTLQEKSEGLLDKNTEYKIGILKKLEKYGADALNDDEIQYINYLRIMMEDDIQDICVDTDFNEDDDYCARCENFDACFLRRVRKYL